MKTTTIFFAFFLLVSADNVVHAQQDSSLKISDLQFFAIRGRPACPTPGSPAEKKDTSKVEMAVLFLVNYPERMAGFEYKIGTKKDSADWMHKKARVHKSDSGYYAEGDSGKYRILGNGISFEFTVSKRKLKKIKYLSVYAMDVNGKKTNELTADYSKMK